MLAVLALSALAQRPSAREPVVDAAHQLRLAEAHRQRPEENRADALARAVLDQDSNHAGARAFLGYRHFRGRWRLEPEIAYLLRAETSVKAGSAPRAAAPSAAAAETVVARMLRGLRQQDERAAATARDALVALAERDHRPELRDQAVRDFWRARLAWQRARAVAVGILSLRLQQIRLLGFDTVTVGFGTGTGRLMLPRTESISFGGTVAVPMGIAWQ